MNAIKSEQDEIPIQEIGGELKPGMTKVFFPAEAKRFVHVSRAAIIANTKNNKNHPTIVVIDEAGKKYAYHAVVLRGPSALKYSAHEPGIDANVFLVTKAGIEAYTDPNGDLPVIESDVYKQPVVVREPFVKRLRKVFGFVKYVPIAGCLMYGDD